MDRKNSKIWVLVIALCSVLFSACSGGDGSEDASANEVKKKKLFILKNSTQYQELINPQIRQGIDKVSKEISHYRIEFSPPLKDVAEAELTLKNFIKSEADMILAADPAYSKLMETAAKQNPKIRFAMIEGEFTEAKLPENLANYRFYATEMGFLSAVAAQKLTATKQVLVMGGSKDKVREAFVKGFEKAVNSLGGNMRFEVEYIGNSEAAFENVDYANTLANKYYARGYDIIIQSAGNAAQGIFEAAVRNQKFVFGFGVDQVNAVGEYAKKIFYTSIVKKYDEAAYQAVKNLDAKKFKAERIYLGCKENALDFTVNNANNKIAAIQADLDAIKAGIKEDKYFMPEMEQ